eukprot:scaffold20850_cov90-Isochrysis_galbana.AAC.1
MPPEGVAARRRTRLPWHSRRPLPPAPLQGRRDWMRRGAEKRGSTRCVAKTRVCRSPCAPPALPVSRQP